MYFLLIITIWIFFLFYILHLDFALLRNYFNSSGIYHLVPQYHLLNLNTSSLDNLNER